MSLRTAEEAGLRIPKTATHGRTHRRVGEVGAAEAALALRQRDRQPAPLPALVAACDLLPVLLHKGGHCRVRLLRAVDVDARLEAVVDDWVARLHELQSDLLELALQELRRPTQQLKARSKHRIVSKISTLVRKETASESS